MISRPRSKPLPAHLVSRSLLLIAIIALPSAASAQIGQLSHFLEVDVPSVEITGDLLIDGVPTPASAGEAALFSLAEFPSGEVFGIGAANAQAFGPLRELPGSYGPTYEFSFTSGALPENTQGPIGPAIPIDGSAPVDLDVPTALVTFDLTLNGAPFPVAPGEVADILVRRREGGAAFAIGTADQSPLVVRLIEGSYDVIYAWREGSLLPRNEHAVVAEAVTVSRDGLLSIDVPAFSHRISPLHNGAPFPLSAAARGRIELRDFSTGDRIDMGDTSAPMPARMLIPGTYDATYTRLAGGGITPANALGVVAEDLSIQPPASPGQLSITIVDVISYAVTRDVTLDGAPFPLSQVETGRIVLVGEHGDEIDFGATHEDAPTRQVVPGRYDVYYRRQQGWTAAPGNTNARIASGYRIDGDEALSIDVQTVQLSFDFLVNGAPFPLSQLEQGRFTLVGSQPGDAIDLGETIDAAPTRRVIAGSYDVVYDWIAGSVLVPRNNDHPVLEDVSLAVDQTLVVDVPIRTIVPTFLLDGTAFPADPTQAGEIVLRSASGGRISLGTTNIALPDSVIGIQDDYVVEYEWVAGLDVPRNPRHRIGFTSVPEPGFAPGLALAALWLTRRRSGLRSRHAFRP